MTDEDGRNDEATRLRPANAAQDHSPTERTVAITPEELGEALRVGIGSTIKERFVIEELLGEGGMGRVFRAQDLRMLETQDRDPYIAIKVLNEEFRAHPQSLIALQRECRKSQALSHPNIITVYDFDRDGATAYMTMELLEGDTLRDVVADHLIGGLPLDEALPIIEQLAAGLAFAHEKDIVHSDMKPGNVMLTREGRCKILDLGLGRAVTSSLQAAGDFTVFDASELGALTPLYASAEMLEEQVPLPVDDVYALGCVAYELLSGRHPYRRKPANIARDEGLVPEPLTKGNRRLKSAIMKALAFDRADRFADAGEFQDAIRPPEPLRKSVYAAFAAVVIGIAVFSYISMAPEPPQTRYQDLEPATRDRLDELVRLGDTFFDKKVYQSAYDSYVRAYLVSEREPRVVDRIESFFDTLTAPAAGLPPPVAQNLWCKMSCVEENFGFFRTQRGFRAARQNLATAFDAAGTGTPDCRVCADYRELLLTD